MFQILAKNKEIGSLSSPSYLTVRTQEKGMKTLIIKVYNFNFISKGYKSIRDKTTVFQQILGFPFRDCSQSRVP